MRTTNRDSTPSRQEAGGYRGDEGQAMGASQTTERAGFYSSEMRRLRRVLSRRILWSNLFENVKAPLVALRRMDSGRAGVEVTDREPS